MFHASDDLSWSLSETSDVILTFQAIEKNRRKKSKSFHEYLIENKLKHITVKPVKHKGTLQLIYEIWSPFYSNNDFLCATLWH